MNMLFVFYVWLISMKYWNVLMHSYHGNIDYKFVHVDYKSCLICSKKLYLDSCSRKNVGFVRGYKISKKLTLSFLKNRYIIFPRHTNICISCNKKSAEELVSKNLHLPTTSVHPSISSFLTRQMNNKSSFLSLSSINDEESTYLTGINKEQMQTISNIINVTLHYIFIALSVFKHGLQQRFSGIIFGCSQTTISRAITKVLNQSSPFIDQFLGPSCFKSHVDYLNHKPKCINKIFERAIACADGTYFYIEKSLNFQKQKQTYSPYKHRNLLKAMVITFLDGTFFDIYGMFYADGYNNDEQIMNVLMDESKEDYNCEELNAYKGVLCDLFEPEDEFLCDRGFDRCEVPFKLHTPKSIRKGELQLSPSKANATRMITRFRNVNEIANGRLKHFKILRDTINTNYIPKLICIIRLIAAIINAFYDPILSENEQINKDVDRMIANLDLDNEVMRNESLVKRGWTRCTLDNFKRKIPTFTLQDIRNWACGSYAIELSHRYISHNGPNKKWQLWSHKSFRNTIKVSGIVSRYANVDSGKNHFLLLRFGVNRLEDLGSWCNRKSGARTSGGCCAHITAALIWLFHLINNKQIPDYHKHSTRKFTKVLDCSQRTDDVKSKKQKI